MPHSPNRAPKGSWWVERSRARCPLLAKRHESWAMGRLSLSINQLMNYHQFVYYVTNFSLTTLYQILAVASGDVCSLTKSIYVFGNQLKETAWKWKEMDQETTKICLTNLSSTSVSDEYLPQKKIWHLCISQLDDLLKVISQEVFPNIVTGVGVGMLRGGSRNVEGCWEFP